MKTPLALFAASIILAPAIATASQQAQPAAGQSSAQSSMKDSVASAPANQGSDSCLASAAGKSTKTKDAHSGKGTMSSAAKDESVAAITKDTGDPPPATTKKSTNDTTCDTH